MSKVVNCVAYREGQRVAAIPVEDISEAIKQPKTFIWLGLHDADEALLLKIQEEFGLHELAIEDARNAHQRPKLEVYGDSVFIVVKTASIVGEQIRYGETHFFAGKNFLISVRHGASSGYAKVRARCEENPHKLAKGPGYALYALLDHIADNYKPVVAEFSRRFQQLEADTFQQRFKRVTLERIYELKRELMVLRDAALPVVDICTELMRFHEDLIPKEIRVYLRDVQDHCRRIIEATDNMREMLMAAMQVNLALVTIGQNEIVKRLAGWGAILAIPTVIFSLYGMNFEVMPELKWPYAYPAILSVTVLACITLYRKLKNTEWL